MQSNAGNGGKPTRSIMERLHSNRLILWWSIAWAVAVMALAPLVNFITPFLNLGYANQWTPDIYWRLVLYWHGGIFIPWITVLAVLVTMKFKLDTIPGIAGRLIKESVFVGGFIAVPVGGIAGIFDVYDSFAMGIPLWTQIAAFVIGDEMAIALIVAMLVRPRTTGGYRSAGMPYYTIFVGVTGALFAAIMGHVSGWITWFGPAPGPLVPQYINSTEGFYNSTAVISFTENVAGSHSHLMLVALMAGVVALAALSFGYESWSKRARRVADAGFLMMAVSLATAIWLYIAAAAVNYPIPTFFQSGAMNGIAGDDIVTGIVGFGATFVLAGMLMHSRRGTNGEGKPLIKDALFLSAAAAWITIYLVIPVTGYYIELNEGFYQNAGVGFDQVFLRFHQDLGFFLLPAVVTLIVAVNAFGISGKIRKYVGVTLIGGIAAAFAFGEMYAMYAMYAASLSIGTGVLALAVVGGVAIGAAVLAGAVYLARVKKASSGNL